MLEYVELSSEELRAELRQPRRLFYRGVEDDPAPAEALEAVPVSVDQKILRRLEKD